MASRYRGRRALLGLVLGLAPAAGALAQPGIKPSTPQQLNPAGQTQAQPRRNEGDLLAPPEAGPCPLAGSNLSFTLSSVEVKGAVALTPGKLLPAWRDQLGHSISVAEICGIRDRLSTIIFRQGILARVNIPEQHIADGHLVLEVIEARIASVRVHGSGGPGQAKVEDYIERLRGLAPFNLRTAQRYLLLAQDVPGMRVSASLKPSAQGGGAVDLEVTVERQPVDTLVNVQNFGSDQLGRWGGLARADLNGFTPLGERTTLIVYSTLFDDEQQVFQLVEDARIGSSGLLGRLSVAYGLTHPGGAEQPLNLDGSSLVGEFQLVYPLIRSRRRNLRLIGSFDYVDQRTDFAAGGTLTNDRLRVLSARLEGDLHQFWWRRAFDLSGGLEVRQGLPALGASNIGQGDLSRFEGVSDATVVKGDGRVQTQWTSKLSTLVSFQGQYAYQPLLSYEELAVGNLTIGRGYDPSSVQGDRGVAGAVEVRLGPYRFFKWLNVQGYGFYDAAYIETVGTNGDSVTVKSAGGGLRVRLTDRYSLDVAYAHPFDRINLAANRPPPSRVLVSLVANFP